MVPKSNTAYWIPKLIRNKERDKRNYQKLVELGWKVISVRECTLLKKEADGTLQALIDQIRSNAY